MVDQKGQASYWNDKKLHSKGVMVSVISSPEFHIDQVDGGIGASNVDDLVAKKRDERAVVNANSMMSHTEQNIFG